LKKVKYLSIGIIEKKQVIKSDFNSKAYWSETHLSDNESIQKIKIQYQYQSIDLKENRPQTIKKILFDHINITNILFVNTLNIQFDRERSILIYLRH
jgi:hypothetical protein